MDSKEWDYRKPSWGHDINIFGEPKHGYYRVMGFAGDPFRRMRNGDTVLLKMQSGKTGRFVMSSVEPVQSVDDGYKGKMAFLDYA